MKSMNKRIYAIIAVMALLCLLGGGTRSIGMNRTKMRS